MSRLTRLVFALVNASLIRIKNSTGQLPPDIYQAPSWVPWAGAGTCIVLLAADAAVKLWA